jgi:cell division GTPase FtsZ
VRGGNTQRSLSILLTLISLAILVWNIAAGFEGARAYALGVAVVVTIVARIWSGSEVPSRPSKEALSAKRKVSIIGVGGDGMILLRKLQYGSLPFKEHVHFVAVIDDIRVEHLVDAYIPPQRDHDGVFAVPEDKLSVAIETSDFLAVIAHYRDELSLQVTPTIARLAQAQGCSVALHILMPFFFEGDEKCKRAIASANELLDLNADDLKTYSLDLIGGTYGHVAAADQLRAADMAVEKVTATIREDLSQRISETMQKAPLREQMSDVRGLAEDLKE